MRLNWSDLYSCIEKIVTWRWNTQYLKYKILKDVAVTFNLEINLPSIMSVGLMFFTGMRQLAYFFFLYVGNNILCSLYSPCPQLPCIRPTCLHFVFWLMDASLFIYCYDMVIPECEYTHTIDQSKLLYATLLHLFFRDLVMLDYCDLVEFIEE